MTAREVVLDGGSPWGFRMHGGVDVQQPLRISRVNPGSKAANKGVREGDIITSINNQLTRDLTNSDAHILLKRSGDNLKLGLNEDCKGSPKRRQYKIVQHENHSESIERSNTSCTKTISLTINRNQSDPNESESFLLKQQSHHNGEPENGVISQRSTLSSSSRSSSASVTSLQGEPRGIGTETRQEARDSAARNNLSGNFIEIAATKPIATDKEKNVIADTVMGGHSRSHKKRSRDNRKKCMNLNVVSSNVSTGETMVEISPSSTSSDATDNVINKSDAENATNKVQNGNKLLERVHDSYRVESPETVTSNSQKLGNIIKSKSLDDDDLVKITELSETSENEDKNLSECNAVITEANSDVEWEEADELKCEDSNKEFGECLNFTSLPLEDELKPIKVNLISPKDEENLRVFLQGINLVTSPEEFSCQSQKKEGYKERKARNRAAIAEHFMPVLQHPRYLEVIKEESSDNSDSNLSNNNGNSKSGNRVESEKVIVVGGKLTEPANVLGTWSTSFRESSKFDAEYVYLEDSDDSDDSTDTEETTVIELPSVPILPPASQLTPPPTPENPTPKNELVIHIQNSDFNSNDCNYLKGKNEQDVFNKEFKNFCDELNLHDYRHANAISPSISSTSSDSIKTQCTTVYNPTCSLMTDVSELIYKDQLIAVEPLTLRELCLKALIELPFGVEILQELAQVSQGIEELTGYWQVQLSHSLQKLRKHLPASITSSLKPSNERQTNDSFTIPATTKEMTLNPYTKWVGIPTQQDPNVLVCLSPTQKSHLETTKAVPDEAGKLLALHQMYLNRRGYYEKSSNENDDIKISKLSSNLDTINEKLSQPTEFSNRLLAIIRESSNTERSSNTNLVNTQRDDVDNKLFCKNKVNNKMVTEIDKKVDELGGQKFTNLAREKSASVPHLSHELSNRIDADVTTGSYQNKVLNEGTQVQGSVENTTRFANIYNRRFSLPQEVHQRQIQYIREREREIQEEIEELEKEKRKLLLEMAAEEPQKQFEASQYNISKKGDIAIRNDEKQPLKTETDQQKTIVMAPTEIFRRQMYNEYMQKIADREERKLQKVIKITSSRTTQNSEIENNNNLCEVTHVCDIENEFMDKVKERMRKFGLKRDDSEESRIILSDREDNTEPVLVIDGESLKNSKGLPKHLREFVNITRRAADNNEEGTDEGVWSPGQRYSEGKPKQDNFECRKLKEEDEAIPPVWTPRSAGSSPTAERKEFKSVNFESSTLGRKNKSQTENSGIQESQPPWKVSTSTSDVGAAVSSSLEKRLPTSHSAPASGFTEFSSSRLPKAQNPTITLLQKAREGQLPRGASYIQSESTSYKRDDKPPVLTPGQVLYHIKSEYTLSDSDHEKPRKMADLSQRKYEMGIGPTTKDGMPLVLRSEVKDSNQSRWYKKMYDTIHKQKPDREYVTVRYKQRRARYPYTSGYFSEPEQHSAFNADYYDSDGTASDHKYATLDRRRIQPSKDKENDYLSSTIPRDRETIHTDIIRHGQDVYKNQPGRIENYIPGRSSISEKEAKEWWDEVMDIFDGHLEQQKTPPPIRGYMSQALKESGYESDSTLIFRRREDALQQLSPSEQKEAYKTIQKGGDVPLQGLRKPAPERPREDKQYFPHSPTFKRIKHKTSNQITCYPVSIPSHPRHVFAEYKRSAPSSSFLYLQKTLSSPPSPPKRRSSRNSNTMRLISTINLQSEKSPSSKRHETCFTPTSETDKNKIKYLKDKIVCKLSTKIKPDLETKTLKVLPSLRTNVLKHSTNKLSSKGNNVNSSKSSSITRSSSYSPIRKVDSTITNKRICTKSKPGTFGAEKQKFDQIIPKPHTSRNDRTTKHTDILPSNNTKQISLASLNVVPSGTTYKKSNALYSSTKNGLINLKEKSLPIRVGISQRGRELLRPLPISSSLPNTPLPIRTTRTRTSTPSPCFSSFSDKSKSLSQKSLNTSIDSLKSLKTFKKESTALSTTNPTISKLNKHHKLKIQKDVNAAEVKKLKKSKKDQLNGEIAKREKRKLKINKTDISTKKNGQTLNTCSLSKDDIQKQRDVIQSDSFFQHLFWKNLPLIPPIPIPYRTSWITEKTRMLQRNASVSSEPTIGALRIYLNHTKPVSESRFKTLDASIVRSRSVSPKSVTWGSRHFATEEKLRSTSLPPKIVLTETSRPISPILVKRRIIKDALERQFVKGSTNSLPVSKLVFSETSRPVSPNILRKQYNDFQIANESIYVPKVNKLQSAKLIFTETSRPVSPVIERKVQKRELKRSSSPTKLIFTETSRPVSPVISKRGFNVLHECGINKNATTSRIFFETNRPFSPKLERKHMNQDLNLSVSENMRLPSKMFFTETSRPVSPIIEKQVVRRPKQPICSSQVSLQEIYESSSRSSSPYFKKNSLVTPKAFAQTGELINIEKEQRFRGRSYSPLIKHYYIRPESPGKEIIKEKRVNSPSSYSLPEPDITSISSELSDDHDTSVSPCAKLYFSETNRPVSPSIIKKEILYKQPLSSSLHVIRSPSSRRISQSKSLKRDEVQRKPRSRSVNEADDFIFYEDDQDSTQNEHKFCCSGISHSAKLCNRFKELNKFYSTLERMGELERTTSSSELRPRGKHEEEIIDYDRWKEVHTRERAEKELEIVYNKLKDDQKEKGFLFCPKNVESFRWKQELDRGLRSKDKSVENIKDNFEKLKKTSNKSLRLPDEIIFRRDLYKPLWRGNSVVDLVSSMVERRSQSEGRITTMKKKLLESERLLTRGIGSRIWSSLSSEQINLLKGQLSEIYSQNGQIKNQISNIDCSINVPSESKKLYKPVLTVRRNSNEIIQSRQNKTEENVSLSLILSENDKKRLSQSLSKEVMNRISERQKNRASLSLVKGKETRGAIAAADANVKTIATEVISPRTCYSLELSEDEKDKTKKDNNFLLVLKTENAESTTAGTVQQPKKALVSTDVTNRVTSVSETESGSTDESTKTVIYLGNKDVVQKKVEYFEHVAEERPYTPTIYRAAESQSNDGESPIDTQQHSEIDYIEEIRQPRKLVASQSYQDLKELFGEQKSSAVNSSLSGDEVEKQELVMKCGEVIQLKNKFECLNDFHSNKSRFGTIRRTRSNPELYRKQIIIPGQVTGEVDNLRRKYEYPWIFNRGRSRIRRGGVVSPIYFKAEDRYMPHINIISKIASLYPKKTVFLSDVKQKSAEELAKILGCPVGEVERMRKKFDSPERNISLLGHMFTSSPNMHELRDIAPYLMGSWTAHKYPKMKDNTRSLSSPEHTPSTWDISAVKKDRLRPKSVSPPRTKVKHPSPILKTRRPGITENGVSKQKYDPKIHQPVGRYQPQCPRFEPVRYKSAWPHAVRPTVTFKELPPPTPPPKGHHGIDFFGTESPRRYVENDVTIHYKTPIRQEVKDPLSEEELSRRQAEHMKRVYEEERRRKYLQELQDMNSRRHTDNFIPTQKSPIPLNRYDDFPLQDGPKIKPRPRSPEHRLVARALYNFVGQSARELTFRKGDIIYIKRQVDKNWYEGEHNAMIGLFPANYAEIIPYDGMKSTPRRNHEGQARAKFNFIAQTHLELSLAKGELVVITRKVDDNWYEGRIGGRKGIFPVSYVEVLIDPGLLQPTTVSSKPVASPAAHSMLLNGSAGGKESMGSHSYTPSYQPNFASSYRAKPVQIGGNNYASLSKSTSSTKNPINEALHIDTHSEPVPYRALYKYRPQNDDELELLEGDVVYVLEKCDDGWYVGSSQRSGAFGTFPGNYVERI